MTKKIAIVTVLMVFVASLSFPSAAQTNRTPNAPATNQTEISSAYTPLRVNPAQAQNQGEVVRLCQSGSVDDAGKATIFNFFQQYFFARWTDQNNATEFVKYKKEIQELVGSVSTPQGKDVLLGFMVSYLSNNIADKKEFYPACRYNAILALGELDEGVQADGRPVPAAKALVALYKAYTNKGDGNDTAREAVRLGALQGIRRHVILGIGNAQARDGLITDLLITIAADTPYKKGKDDSGASANNIDDDDIIVLTLNPNAEGTSEPHRTVELHNWFRGIAIETLGHLSGAGAVAQDKIIATLLTRIEDDSELPSIRYQCAYSLSRFNRTIEASDDLLKKTTNALLTLGLSVYDDGIQTMLEERSTQQTTGTMGGGTGRGMGATGGGSDTMGMGGGGGMGGYAMTDSSGSGMGTSMGQAQADQINNSLIQIKDGFSSIVACVQGPDFRSGGLMTSESVKNTPYHEVLTGLNKTIAECVKFLDNGDPAAAERAAKTATQTQASGMDSTSSGGTTAATVKNQPKVNMKEIEDRLKIVKSDIEYLQNIMSKLDAGVVAAK